MNGLAGLPWKVADFTPLLQEEVKIDNVEEGQAKTLSSSYELQQFRSWQWVRRAHFNKHAEGGLLSISGSGPAGVLFFASAAPTLCFFCPSRTRYPRTTERKPRVNFATTNLASSRVASHFSRKHLTEEPDITKHDFVHYFLQFCPWESVFKRCILQSHGQSLGRLSKNKEGPAFVQRF